ncbi:hypothetical protein AAFC00_002838 [Neodothiora populina]|uniref:Bromodomain associated domain-containing protein n=1 Tax=Neodothiora populina TaxID=2781224 RepID=A0ABR3P8P8_9PEZI
MSAAQQLHSSLLRMPIIYILRAAGFHSTRPSVLDTLVNIAERYLLLLAESTLNHALDNHNTNIPTVTDVRLALTECGALIPIMSAAEEDWTEKFRHSMSDYDDMKFGDTRRTGESNRRADEDARDVREFIQWIMSDQNKEIRRIAGVLPEVGPGGIVAGEDYLTALKKKHSKTGEESRYQGTLLGKPAEDRPVKIEGGPFETLHEWQLKTSERIARGEGNHVTAAKNNLAHEEEVSEQQHQIAMDVS